MTGKDRRNSSISVEWRDWPHELQELLYASPFSDIERLKLRTLCIDVAAKYGLHQLAGAIQTSVGGRPLTPITILNLVDALRGHNAGDPFPTHLIGPLLETLDIDFDSFQGADFGELFSTLLLLTKSSRRALSAEEAGTLLYRVFAAKKCDISAENFATAVQVMWEDGFSWGPSLGAFFSRLMPPKWAQTNAGALVCSLTQGCIEEEELDMIDFQEIDKNERDAHNPAVKIGLLLDAIVPREEQTAALGAQVVRAVHSTFGGGGAGEAERAALFAGRVLQQLQGLQEGGGGLLSEEVRVGAPVVASVAVGEAADWKLDEAVKLACLLCSGSNLNSSSGTAAAAAGDWRTGHVYYVGDILKQLRKEWRPNDVSHLMAALQSPKSFPPGNATAPRRHVIEVLEGLGADYSVVLKENQGSAMRVLPHHHHDQEIESRS